MEGLQTCGIIRIFSLLLYKEAISLKTKYVKMLWTCPYPIFFQRHHLYRTVYSACNAAAFSISEGHFTPFSNIYAFSWLFLFMIFIENFSNVITCSFDVVISPFLPLGNCDMAALVMGNVMISGRGSLISFLGLHERPISQPARKLLCTNEGQVPRNS